MDRLQRFALKKTVDGLDKVLKAKEHFDKKEEKRIYTKKIVLLKQHLTDLMFHGEGAQRSEAYEQISRVDEIQSRHELSNQDKRYLDELIKQYKDK